MRQILTNAVIEYFQRKTLKKTLKIRISVVFLNSRQLQTAAVAQSVRAFASQAEGWVFESKPWQT